MKELFAQTVTFALNTLLLGLVLHLAVWADLALILRRPPRPRILKVVPLVLVVLAACAGAWAKHCSGLGQSIDAYDLDMLAWLLAGAAAWLFLLRAALARFATAQPDCAKSAQFSPAKTRDKDFAAVLGPLVKPASFEDLHGSIPGLPTPRLPIAEHRFSKDLRARQISMHGLMFRADYH